METRSSGHALKPLRVQERDCPHVHWLPKSRVFSELIIINDWSPMRKHLISCTPPEPALGGKQCLSRMYLLSFAQRRSSTWTLPFSNGRMGTSARNDYTFILFLSGPLHIIKNLWHYTFTPNQMGCCVSPPSQRPPLQGPPLSLSSGTPAPHRSQPSLIPLGLSAGCRNPTPPMWSEGCGHSRGPASGTCAINDHGWVQDGEEMQLCTGLLGCSAEREPRWKDIVLLSGSEASKQASFNTF